MVKQVASNVAYEAGDGTTTATVLSQAILNKGIKLIEAGFDPMDLKLGMDIASEFIKDYLSSSAIKVDSVEQVEHVATISANGDKKIGTIIADAMEHVGFDGVVTVEDSKTHETYMELVEGMQFDSGYMSPYFVNNPSKLEVEFTNPYVLIYNGKIQGLKGLITVLDFTSAEGRPLLIIADQIEGDALQALVLNSAKGVIKVAAVRSPSYGENKKEQLKDISTVLGATLLSEDEGHDIANIDPAYLPQLLGTCDKLTVTGDRTTIVNGNGNPEDIQTRISIITSQIENKENESEKLLLKERLAKLEGGVAILKIGAYSEVELKEKKDRLDDALSATRAAIEEGILPGGGVALLNASIKLEEALKAGSFDNIDTPDKEAGVKILIEACTAPLNAILNNAGISFDVVKNGIIGNVSSFGYDARKNQYVDMIDAGIIDPAKVTRCALENSVSIAGLMITTECTLMETQVNKQQEA
jgi:chaperonin GroEL